MISPQNPPQQLNGNKIKITITFIMLLSSVYGCTPTKSVYRPPIKHNRPIPKDIEKEQQNTFDNKQNNKTKENKPIQEDNKSPLQPNIIYKKDNNTVLLLLPFNANKVDFNNLNSPNQFKDNGIAIDFYRGFKMALDENKNHSNLQIKVFDTQENAKKIKEALRPQYLKNAKLIIGPLFPYEIDKALNELHKENASNYVISPLASKFSNESGYKNFIMINPPIYVHAEKLAAFTLSRHRPKRIIYISIEGHNEEDFDNENFTHPFINYILSFSPNTIIENTIISNNNIEQNLKLLETVFTTKEENILFMPYDNIDDWYIIMRTLNAIDPANKISIVAHPNLIRFYRKLDVVKLQQYNTYLSSASFIDTNKESVVNFFNDYRKTYFTIASKYAISGYDMGSYLTHIISTNDPNKIFDYKYQGLLNNIELKFSHENIINQSIKILNITAQGPVIFESY